MPIELRTLTDGGQPPAEVARELADVPRRRAARASTSPSTTSASRPTPGALVLATLLAAQQRGVAVRLVYNVDHPGPIPVPPPPEHGRAGDRGAARPDTGDRRASPT